MNIEQAKRIPLAEILSRLGHQPRRQARGQLWYLSPFRNETDPSFKVNQAANLWYDFGLGKGGDAIDLVMELDRLGSVSDGLARIDELMGGQAPSSLLTLPEVADEPAPAPVILRTGPVQARSLVAYLKKRGIDPQLAAPYVQEVHYQRGKTPYFALGFANDSGGYELRTPYFKGTLGPKNITTIPGDSDRVLVFEGFFDFLAAVARSGQTPAGTVLVLNSVSTKENAAEAIRRLHPSAVELYRDRDAAGEQLLAYLRLALPRMQIIDESVAYSKHKDVNDWHCAQVRR